VLAQKQSTADTACDQSSDKASDGEQFADKKELDPGHRQLEHAKEAETVSGASGQCMTGREDRSPDGFPSLGGAGRDNVPAGDVPAEEKKSPSDCAAADPKSDLAAYLSHLKEQLRKMDVNPEELKNAGSGKVPKKKTVVLSTVQEGNAVDNPQRGSLLRWGSYWDIEGMRPGDWRSLPSIVTWYRERTVHETPIAPSNGASCTAQQVQVQVDIPPADVDPKEPSLDDFELLRLVGQGGFGKVYQVRKKISGRIMALKVMRKHMVIEELNVEGTRNEKSVLESVMHPFIVRLHCAFHDSGRLYLLMDWHNGGQLLRLLDEHSPFTESQTRFYISELVLAVEELHARGIVHRDLKPENVLIDSHGHLVVTDFGASKISCMEEEMRTNSWVGTELYMAPEQLEGKVYGRVVDWWAIGVLCWEMLVGENPFYHKNSEQIAQKVLKKKLVIPKYLSGPAHSLLKTILNRDPERRLGKNGAGEIKEHLFFSGAKGFSWKKVYDKVDEPPFKNTELLENPESLSQISDSYTSRPAVLSPLLAPGMSLSPKSQALFSGFEWVSPFYSPAVMASLPILAPTTIDLGTAHEAQSSFRSLNLEQNRSPPPVSHQPPPPPPPVNEEPSGEL